MNVTTGGGPAVMPAVSQHVEEIWKQLRFQISPFNTVIAIDGRLFNSMNNMEKRWLLLQYKAAVHADGEYIRDSCMFRIFLAPKDMFPARTTFPIHGPVTLYAINPALMNNVDIPAAPVPTPLPKMGPVERRNTAKNAKILRPPNAFILYRKAHHEAVKAARPGIHNNQISVILGNQWQREDPEVRAQYRLQAAQLKQEHMEKYPDYQYQPRKASELKRRMTKKKAAALARNEASTEDVLGIGNALSDHEVSKISASWGNPYLTSVTRDCSAAGLVYHVDQHNAQQELNPFVEGSTPQLLVTDNFYKNVWGDTKAERDSFEEFINSYTWT